VEQFHEKLRRLLDDFVFDVYRATDKFPKAEIFGITSQLRRAALSIALNYIEGYARRRKTFLKSFLEISYGSLQETKYLLEFSYKRQYLEKEVFDKLMSSAEEIGAMIWGILSKL